VHPHLDLVERVGDRLAAPIFVGIARGTEIGDHYDDGPEWTPVVRRVRVRSRGYLEATPASVAVRTAGTERELVGGGGVPGVHPIAARGVLAARVHGEGRVAPGTLHPAALVDQVRVSLGRGVASASASACACAGGGARAGGGAVGTTMMLMLVRHRMPCNSETGEEDEDKSER